jgi:putative SOS response-associated peptidase YedK
VCNLYTQSKSVDEVARIFRDLQIPLRFPDGIPNMSPRDIAITDPGPIVRASCTPAKGPRQSTTLVGTQAGAQSQQNNAYELIVRRWSWPGPGGKPVYNFRSDGREFGSGRCLIVADGFYEFTAAADSKQKRKDRWLFTFPDEAMIGIAGLVRATPDFGEAFTMLTTEPGPDVAPYHNRQICVLPAADWSRWLDPKVPARDVLRPLPAGSLSVEPAPR